MTRARWDELVEEAKEDLNMDLHIYDIDAILWADKVVQAAEKRQALLEYLAVPGNFNKDKWLELEAIEYELRDALEGK